MTKEGQGFEMWAGASKEVTVTVTDAITGGSVDLTGTCITWAMTSGERGDSRQLTKASHLSGGSAITISGCTFSFVIPHADTDALQGSYYHEAEVKDTSACVYKAMTGYVTVNQGAL